MSTLCAIADVKSALDITTTNKDTLITALVAAASAWIEGEADRTFASTSYTEAFSPGRDDRVMRGLTVLRPRQYPLISVTSLHQDSDRVFDASSLIAAADYFTGSLTVELYEDGDTVSFDPGQRTVQLIYVAGYATIPEGLVSAAGLLCAAIFNRRKGTGRSSESLGNFSYSAAPDMWSDVVPLLARYRKWAESA